MNSYETIKENKENGILSFSDFTIKTKMVNDKEKKEPKFRTPWKTITFDNCLENVNSNVAVICGKVSGITIIDFDDEESYDQMRKDFPMLDEFKLVETNNGFHIYGKYNPDLKTGTNMFEKYPKVDIRNDDSIVFAPPTKYTLLDGTVVEYEDKHGAILQFPTELVQLQKHLLKKEKIPLFDNASIMTNTENFTPFHRAIVDNINPELYTSYGEWMKLIGALGTFENGLELANEYSKKLLNYVSKKDVEKHMTYNTSFGFLVNLSKKSNLFNHKIIVGAKYLGVVMSDYAIAEIASYLIDDIIKVNDEIYHYNTYWEKDTSKGETNTRKQVIDVLRSFFKFQLKQTIDKLGINLDPDSEEYKTLTKKKTMIGAVITNSIEKSSASKNILDMYRMNLPCSDIQFDKNPYLFCFKNCAFDLRTNKPYDIKREDYITIYLPYDYIKSTEEQIDEIHGLFNTILSGEPLECYLSILRSAMIGISYEYFVMLNGSGGNGKGLSMDLFASMCGEYCYKGKSSTLLNELKGGADPELANMHKKRCTRFAEVPDKAVLNMGTIKDMTGGGELNARKLFSNNTQTLLENTTIFECNKKPTINDRIDDSVIRRFIVIDFPKKFTIDESKLSLPNYVRGNPLYKTSQWKEEYRTVLFDYLLTFDYIDIHIPHKVRESTMAYLMEADALSQFMTNHFIITDDESDITSLSKMALKYKEMNFSPNSRTYKAFTAKSMEDLLDKSVLWKMYKEKYFHDRYRNKKVDKLKVFVGIKEIVEETDCENECENI